MFQTTNQIILMEKLTFSTGPFVITEDTLGFATKYRQFIALEHGRYGPFDPPWAPPAAEHAGECLPRRCSGAALRRSTML